MTDRRVPGDHFSGVAAGYAAFRPQYPRALFEFLATIAPRRGRVWDCGTGTGQAAVDLAEWFDEVIATDVSAAQIAQAPPNSRIEWLVSAAESTPIRPASIDLVTVAQALHWFDHPRFYDEVRRVAAPGAAIAAWTYGSPRMAGEVGEALRRFSSETVGPYWPPERRHVDAGYRTIPFPFPEIAAPALNLVEHWSRAQLAGYLRTWSATTRYVAKRGHDPVEQFEHDLETWWPDQTEQRPIEWPLIVIAGRVDVRLSR